MNYVRTFVAIPLQPDAQQQIARLADRLRREVEGVRWVRDENVHLTLAFLGEIDATLIPAFCDAVGQACRSHDPFTLHLRGVGAFPDVRRPRVVWVGVAEGAQEAVALQWTISEHIEPLGYRLERRPYVPHLTIGRLRTNRGRWSGVPVINGLADWTGGDTYVSQVEVMSSQLSRDEGARYAVLSTHVLGGVGCS